MPAPSPTGPPASRRARPTADGPETNFVRSCKKLARCVRTGSWAGARGSPCLRAAPSPVQPSELRGRRGLLARFQSSSDSFVWPHLCLAAGDAACVYFGKVVGGRATQCLGASRAGVGGQGSGAANGTPAALPVTCYSQNRNARWPGGVVAHGAACSAASVCPGPDVAPSTPSKSIERQRGRGPPESAPLHW